MNVSAVARRNGVAQSLLYRWRKDAAAVPMVPGAAQTKPAPQDLPPTASPAFVPVALLAAPPDPTPVSTPPPAPPTPPQQPSLIEITLAGGRTVRVSADVDASALARIVAALEGKP